MKNLLFGGVRLNSAIGNFGLLALRLFAGLSLAYAHGWAKVPPPAGFIQMVQSMGMPGEMAYLTMVTEFVGGMLLAAGLATRPVALAMTANMAVAGFIGHRTDPYQRAELAFLFLAVAFMFMCMGAGRFSIDRLLKR
ncbi:MAG: DoxX family protein [Acidobacteria bacterium]|nr:DoxX family protein [Acidobacteriota bacterium]